MNPGSREEPGVPARGRSKQRAIKSPRSHHHTGQMHYTIEVICVCVGGCVRACIHVCMYNSFRSHSDSVCMNYSRALVPLGSLEWVPRDTQHPTVGQTALALTRSRCMATSSHTMPCRKCVILIGPAARRTGQMVEHA